MAPSGVIQGWFPHGLPRFDANRATAAADQRAATRRPVLSAPITQLRRPTGGRLHQGATQLPQHLSHFPTFGGRPLPPQVRQKMEAAFQANFADVRVHIGPHVTSLGALAFTQDSNIHFAPGQYDPFSTRGQQNLARELTYVVQQRKGRVTNPFGTGVAIVHNQAMDREAERMALSVATFRSPTIQRRKIDDSFIESDLLEVFAAKKADIDNARPLDRPALLRDSVLEKWVLDFETNTVNKRDYVRDLKAASAIDDADVAFMWLHVTRYLAAVRVDAARALQDAKNGASDVTITQNGVEVWLDNDQLKHQPIGTPIGTRVTSGGNKFKSSNASKAWHQANTLPHMAQWAAGLGRMYEGESIMHGQGMPVNEIHYEGFCLFSGGKKYAFFHCYPAHGSSLKQ
jgi:hypothetical protein